jgi:hypothetical protein
MTVKKDSKQCVNKIIKQGLPKREQFFTIGFNSNKEREYSLCKNKYKTRGFKIRTKEWSDMYSSNG